MAHIVLDVETAGTFGKSLVYDLGFIVVDNGEIVESRNWVINDVYYNMPHKMATAYYAEKLPTYDIEIANGMRKVVNMVDAYREFAEICKTYKIRSVWAYNAKFDNDALNYTVKVCSNGFVNKFFPDNVNVRCIMGAALSTICQSPKFAACAERSEKGNIRVSAECVYKFVSGCADFEEAHTGLEDALIEAEILAACLKRHAKMDTTPKMVTAFPAWREMQKKFRI